MRVWAIVALAGLAWASAAAAAPSGKPRPPATMDGPGVDAWLKAYIDMEGWVLLSADGVAVTLGRPDVQPLENGFLQAELKREYYRPIRLGALNSRSNRQTWNVDCAQRRVQVISMTVFSNNNLQGDSFNRRALEADWTTIAPGAADSDSLGRICSAGRPKP